MNARWSVPILVAVLSCCCLGCKPSYDDHPIIGVWSAPFGDGYKLTFDFRANGDCVRHLYDAGGNETAIFEDRWSPIESEGEVHKIKVTTVDKTFDVDLRFNGDDQCYFKSRENNGLAVTLTRIPSP